MAAPASFASALVLGSLVPSIVGIGALFVVPEYGPLLDAFRGDLPAATRWLLATYRWWWLAPVLVCALLVAWPRPVDRPALALVLGTGIGGAMFAFGLYALYAPVLLLAMSD
jgi:type II secretory pathway component PulF